MLLLIDNYDSFTYNLAQYFGSLGSKIKVVRNDQITLDEIERLNPARLVISPGPGTPASAGISKKAIERFSGRIPILGVCLGHQCIGEVFGAFIVPAKEIMHGKTSCINHDGRGVFKDIPQRIKATRYHSLIIKAEDIPKELIVSARSDDQTIMAIKHMNHPTYGVQFHPESIATEFGIKILENFLNEKIKREGEPE